MIAVMVGKPIRTIPFWAVLMFLGLLLDGVAVTSLFVLRSSGPAGLDAFTRAVLVITLVLGTIVFTVGLAFPMVVLISRAGRVDGAALGSHRVILGTTLLVVLVSNLLPTVYGLSTSVEQLRTLHGFLLAALSVELTLIGASYLRLIHSGQTTWKQLGFDRQRIGPDIVRGLGYGVLAFIVSAVLQAVLDAAGVRQTQLRELAWIRELDLSGFLLVLVLGAVGAPLAEELYFRGYVFASYLREKGPVLAYVLSGVVFASLHLNKEALLPIFILGMMLAWMYRRSNSVIPPMVAHALNNGVAFLIFYFGPTLGQ
ncbi:MAG: lysostaphin resistance A-like protein [Chloroflexota bacterium]